MTNFERAEREYLEEPEESGRCEECECTIPEVYIYCQTCTREMYLEAKLNEHERG